MMRTDDGQGLGIAVAVLILLALAILWLLGLAGCSASRESSGSTAEKIAAGNRLALERMIQGDKPPNILQYIHVAGASNTVIAALPNGGPHHAENLSLTSSDRQNASTDESFWSLSTLKTPLGISLLCGAVALVIGIIAFRYLKTNPAIAAGLNLAENAIKSQIDHVDAKIATASSESERASLLAQARQLEKERGKLGKKV